MPYTRINEPSMESATAKRDGLPKKYIVRHSKKLPNWLWTGIACILGIQKSGRNKPFWANIFYYCTLISALVFLIATVAFAIGAALFVQQNQKLSISSNSTTVNVAENCVFDASVMVIFTLFWCVLGLYSNSLAARLYGSNKMLNMIRLHAKTIFKMNAALVFFLLLSSFVSVNNLRAYFTWFQDASPCLMIGSPLILCRIRFIAQCCFSVFTVLWNSLVGLVLLSVCRTHTMGIRSFIQDLEREAQLYEKNRFGKTASAEDLLWLNGHEADVSSEYDDEANTTDGRKSYLRISALASTPVRLEQLLISPIPNPASSATKRKNSQLGIELQTIDGNFNGPSQAAPTEPQQPMSNAVILQRYWKQSCSMRMSSLTFQRWTFSVTSISLAWIAVNLVQWVPQSPTVLAVSEVVIPLLILPLLCAAYAEVNVEGHRLLKCICPMEERLNALLVLWQSPLQLTVFGVPFSYTSMSTVACALLIALVSRVALKQIGTN